MLFPAPSSPLSRDLRAELFYDFLSAALMTLGIAAAAVAGMRRRRDLLLAYFSFFVFLYGLRLGLERTFIQLLFADLTFYGPLRASLDFLVPIPFLLFFRQAGLLGKAGRGAAYALILITFTLSIVTILTGPHPWAGEANSIAVLLGIGVFAFDMWRRRPGGDTRLAAWGLAAFIAGVVFDNLLGILHLEHFRIEPLGMVFFAGTLGYIAVRRGAHREEKLLLLETELDLARRIQLSILPAGAPNSRHFTVATRYLPMTDVAGDFYDYVVDAEQELAILIADVSGHGIPAALIASMVKLSAASRREEAAAPARVLAGMNASLCGNTQTQFVTAGFLFLDAGSRVMRYAGAAHPPLLRLRGEEVAEFEANGLMLAAFGFAEYQELQCELVPGDRFLLYTDGLLEAADSQDEFFGMTRLKDEFLGTRGLDADRAADVILNAVRKWSKTQDDDRTLVLCEFKQ